MAAKKSLENTRQRQRKAGKGWVTSRGTVTSPVRGEASSVLMLKEENTIVYGNKVSFPLQVTERETRVETRRSLGPATNVVMEKVLKSNVMRGVKLKQDFKPSQTPGIMCIRSK